jgi:hypothetical protein
MKNLKDILPPKDTYDATSNLSPADKLIYNTKVEARNQALTEVEAVLPQMLALAEKRGAEGERERILDICWRHCGTDASDNLEEAIKNETLTQHHEIQDKK